ncbi:MAG: hypothetical protein WC985_07955 [Thermoplasmata archaeon]
MLYLKEKGIVRREAPPPAAVMPWAIYEHLIGASLHPARGDGIRYES